MSGSLASYLEGFSYKGEDYAYVQPQGYRTVRWTYPQVAAMAYRFARELEARAIGHGDCILLWAPNSAEWVAVFFGCLVRGVIVVPMDNAAAPDFALRVTKQVNAKLAVCAAEHLPAFSSSASPQSLVTIVIEQMGNILQRHSSAPLAAVAVEPQDPLEIIFTSGTTAEPKGVVITHGNVLANVTPLETEIRKYLKYERYFHPVRFLNLLPLSHVFGQFLGIFLPQIMAGTVVFQQSFNPTEVIASIHRERVSVLVAVPRLMQSLEERIRRDAEDAGRLEKFQRRYAQAKGKHILRRAWMFRQIHWQFGWKFWAFISGGAALDRDTEEFWGRLGYAVIQGYGLTETTSIVSVNHPFRLGQGSIGKVLAGREVKLAPDGEILVRGGGVAAGYWSGQGVQPMAGNEGWYRTGDIGELDAAGNLYFKGRKKTTIVTPAGMNVYPEDLEAALRRQPEVKDCVVIALPRDKNAEPCAVLILRDRTGDPAPVVAHANELLAEHQRMREWLVWPEEDFPRTSTQKPKTGDIQKYVVSHLRAGTAAGAIGEDPHSPLAEMIGKISGHAPGHLSAGAKLDDELNLSSLDRVELLSALEDRYQIDLSETNFASASTVGDVEKMLHGKTPGRMRFHYPGWVQRWPVTWLRGVVHYLLLRPAVFLLGRPRVEGRENLRGVRGPVIVICNHTSDVDVGLVKFALPASLRYRLAVATGGEELERLRTPPVTRSFLGRAYDRVKWGLAVSLLNLFPLPREAGFRESFAFAGESVDHGYSILVFPEGRHTKDGTLLPFRAGIGLLANNLGLPVVPMRIDGLFEVIQRGKKFAAPGKIAVRIGRPVHFEGNTDPQAIASDLQKVVAAL